MIREKIFKLQRHKSSASSIDASAEKIDFTFSNIQALQVPKGWDKLSLSLISSETGKIIRKSGKASVKNGICRWTETLLESIWISNIDRSKEQEQYFFKFLVATGSSRTGVLGETTVNLAAFLSSEAPTVVSLPLKKCNYGTILQVEIKCLTPKTTARDEKWKEINARKHEYANDEEIVDDKSELSDYTLPKSSSDKYGLASRPRELCSRETSFSASVSSYSFDSMDEAMGRQSLSSQSNQNTTNYIVGRQDSIESHESVSYSSYSSKMFKEVEDSTVDELRAEARMWEQNARKLGEEVETLRKESATLRTDNEKSREEIERLRTIVEENDRTRDNMHKEELEDEIRFQKRSNENLSLQLNKTQESNLELISILQEMEETIEKQRIEIESLSVPKLESIDTNSTISGIDMDEQIPRENKCDLEIEFMNLPHKLQAEVSFLKSLLEEKTIETEIEQGLTNLFLRECLVECSYELAVKEHEISKLESALSRASGEKDLAENNVHVVANKEIERLKEKVRELETDCNELTEENLALLFELKELTNDSCKCQESCFKSSHEGPVSNVPKLEISSDFNEDVEETLACNSMMLDHNADTEEKNLESPSEKIGSEIHERDCIDRICETRPVGPENGHTLLIEQSSEIEEENVYLWERISGLEAQLRHLTETSESTRLDLEHSESQVTNLRAEIRRMEEEIELRKMETKQKLSEMGSRWLETLEECRSLSKVNIRLESTTESLIQDYNSLQKYNLELREQKLNFQNQFLELEEKMRNFQNSSEIENDGIDDQLEMRIKVSEIERLRLSEENDILNMQLEKVPVLQNEVLNLRILLKEMKLENQIMEDSVKSLSSDYEELKCKSDSVIRENSTLQKIASEAEDCMRKKIALEEKILRVEGDLIALCVEEAEVKRVNSQLKIKVKNLEDVREELLKRTQSLEEELKKTRNREEDRKEFTSNCQSSRDDPNATQELELPKGFNERDSCSTRCQGSGIDCESRIRLLEKELIGALEANDIYKTQLKRAEAAASEKLNESKISSLEAELQEIRERYLQISLKYAEVEDQREQLVMKLKTLNCWSSFAQK